MHVPTLQMLQENERKCHLKTTDMLHFISYSAFIFLFHRERPMFGTLILTDRCNLSCAHCKLSGYRNEIYSYEQVYSDMSAMYKRGVRILCLSGGEIALWEKSNRHTLRELVQTAKRMGFLYVILATNGTIPVDYGQADFVLISIDGTKKTHNRIRGNCYDDVLNTIRSKRTNKIVIYMAINKWNRHEIGEVCKLAQEEPSIRAVSFNFHTPFSGTQELLLSREEKKNCCQQIRRYMRENYPILNLKSCFPAIIEGNFRKPCRQMMVMDHGVEMKCNRCIREKGLCRFCGYFETAEVSSIFQGKISVLLDALHIYGKYL